MRMPLLLLCLALVACTKTVVVGGNPAVEEEPEENPTPNPDPDPNPEPDPDPEPTEVICTYFVSTTEAGDGTGSSWDNTNSDLGTLLTQAGTQLADGDCSQIEIRLSKGTYKPHADDRTQSFILQGGMTLRGGYQGTADDPNNRDITLFDTVLSGDIGTVDSILDNSYHVLRFEDGGEKETRLDGLLIRSGNATGSDDDSRGGGIYATNSKLRLVDATLLGNLAAGSGAGIYSHEGTLALERVDFTANVSQANGGGIFGSDIYATFWGGQFVSNVAIKGGGIYTTGCTTVNVEGATFVSNQANEGGGIYDSQSQSALLNRLTFASNQAGTRGGGSAFNATTNLILGNSQWVENVSLSGSAIHWADAANSKLFNSTITANNPQASGPALAINGASTLTLKNSIVWNNGEEFRVDTGTIDTKVTASYCIVSSGATGTNVSSANPLFVQAPLNGIFDLNLQAGSPAIDAGTIQDVPEEVTGSDCAAKTRVVGSGIDIGAFEKQAD